MGSLCLSLRLLWKYVASDAERRSRFFVMRSFSADLKFS